MENHHVEWENSLHLLTQIKIPTCFFAEFQEQQRAAEEARQNRENAGELSSADVVSGIQVLDKLVNTLYVL